MEFISKLENNENYLFTDGAQRTSMHIDAAFTYLKKADTLTKYEVNTLRNNPARARWRIHVNWSTN